MGGRKLPWWVFCAKCGFRKKVDNKSHAISECRVHDNEKHKGISTAAYE